METIRRCRHCGTADVARMGIPVCGSCRKKRRQETVNRANRRWRERHPRTTIRVCALCPSVATNRFGAPRCDGCRRGPVKHGGSPDGYVRIAVEPTEARPAAPGRRRVYVLEHHVVMERLLGRQLLPGESVHHRNGVRSDNRAENLELWVVSQPAGQRVADQLAWAQEIIDRYASLRLFDSQEAVS